VVLLEAMATGLPVLASQQGSLPDIIEDGVTGVLVPPGSPEHWANAIRRALAHPDQLTAMGQQARRVFEGNYTPDAGYRRLVEVYGRILERTAALTRS
jgi:glycosyltransferase involved in cell wall biosynthesis